MTGAGSVLFERDMPLMQLEIEKLWTGLGPAEKRLLVHLLSKLRMSLVSASADELAELARVSR